MATLRDQYGSTSYAPRGALLYAKQLWSAGDKAGAKAQLQWVIDRASDDDLKQVARYRLAEALLDEKNVDEALKVLDAKHADAYAGLYADLRGDALAAAGRNDEARAAYQVALAKLDAKTAYRNFVQVKLDSLGGAIAGTPRRQRPRRLRARRHRPKPLPRDAGAGRPGEAAMTLRTPRAPRRSRSRWPAADARRSSRGCRRCRLAVVAVVVRRRQPQARPAARAHPQHHADDRVAARVGKAVLGFAPLVTPQAIYAASSDGTIVRIDPATGRQVWRVSAGRTLSAASARMRWRSSSAPTRATCSRSRRRRQGAVERARRQRGHRAAEGGRGRRRRVQRRRARLRLSTRDGSTVWVYQRANPPLTVRNNAGAVIVRGGVFFGTAGGRLVGPRPRDRRGRLGATVATPKGSTELERIADVTSLPVVDDRNACATAYQGRTACFDVVRGTAVWSRDIGSLGGIATDAQHLYVTDDAGNVHALDRSTGASVWKQDKLAARRIGGPAARRRPGRRRRRRGLAAPALAGQRRLRRPRRDRRQRPDVAAGDDRRRRAVAVDRGRAVRRSRALAR
jgi:hypothetical protein